MALPRYHDSDAFDELEKLVLDYAVAMTRTPPQVDDELFAAMREHFGERQMVELTNMIALENLRSRFNIAFHMSPSGFSEGMLCIVPELPGGLRAHPRIADRRVRILLAGATGVIGRTLLPLLLERGHEVVAVCRSPEKLDGLRAQGAQAVALDALDAAAVQRAMTAARPQAVVHQLTAIPAHINPRTMVRDFAANDRLRTEGTANLLAAAARRGRRALHRSEHRLRLRPRTAGTIHVEQDPLTRARAGPEGVPPLGGRGCRARAQRAGSGRRGAPLRVLLRARERDRARRLDGRRAEASPPSDRRLRGRRVVLRPHRRRRLGDRVRARPRGPGGAERSSMHDPARVSEWIPALARALGAPARRGACRRGWHAWPPAPTAQPA